MITVKSKDLQPIGELENAHKIGYDKSLNELLFATFTLPIDDPNRYLCESFNVIEITEDETGEFIGTFRIIPESTSLQKNKITYQCEHVLATLLDDILFRYHQQSNFTTAQNIQYVLDQQEVKHWVKGTIDFIRYFHYKFENENGLLAPMLSIPKPFDTPYEWTYDTSVYPWVLNLVKPSERVVGELRWGKNMGSFDEHVDPTKIVNRIYPLGAGEGVNQLGIESVNGGVPYIEDAESIAKYGLKKRVFVDRRFEDAQQLKDNAQALLNEWKTPKISVDATGSDLSILEGYEFEKHRVGNLIRIVVPDRADEIVRIVSESKSDLTGKPDDIKFELNNKIDDIATTQTDIQRKIQVNEAYSMGATNILNYDYQDNCDANNPATIKFFLDDDVVNINTCELTFDTEEYRAYSQATEGGGGQTTSSGGGQTTSSGGGQTSSASGDHRHRMFSAIGFETNSDPNTSVILSAYGGLGIKVNDGTTSGVEYYTEGSSGTHSHTVSDHTHLVSDHTHLVSDHTHQVAHGIHKLATLPTSVELIVDGNLVPHTAIQGDRVDVESYLNKQSGRVTRDRHVITIKPNGLARINANLILRVFIQSHLGQTL